MPLKRIQAVQSVCVQLNAHPNREIKVNADAVVINSKPFLTGRHHSKI